jgi:hypothetical protein
MGDGQDLQEGREQKNRDLKGATGKQERATGKHQGTGRE